MEDSISRQAAIDAFYKHPNINWTTLDVLTKINALPSAQPEPCEDAVSRRILLNDLKELITAWKKYPVMAEQIKGVETAIGYVKTIPSVEPKHKTGKWIEYDSNDDKYDVIKCPCCKHIFTVDAYHWIDIGFVKDDFKFCPNCGSENGDTINE